MKKAFLTYDEEGDYLLWKDEPVNVEGLWEPASRNTVTVYPISAEVAAVLGAPIGKEKIVLLPYLTRGSSYSEGLKIRLAEKILQSDLSTDKMEEMLGWVI